jgi:hypothetical protein
MIWYQLLVLILVGPIVLLLLGKFVQAIIRKNPDGFGLAQAIVLFLCVSGIIVAFSGIEGC